MLEKKRSETLLKIISYTEISQKPLVKQSCSQRHLSCVSKNKYGYIDMKTIYRREQKSRNVETE